MKFPVGLSRIIRLVVRYLEALEELSGTVDAADT